MKASLLHGEDAGFESLIAHQKLFLTVTRTMLVIVKEHVRFIYVAIGEGAARCPDGFHLPDKILAMKLKLYGL